MTAPRQAPKAGTRQQQKEATRQALLDAARTVLRERGLGEATTRAIALEAGVAAGTFFVHFPDLHALVDALLDEHIGRALDDAMRTLPKRGGVVRQLVHVSKTLFDSYDLEPDLSRAFLSGALFRRPASGLMTARLESFQRWVSERIDAAIRSGEIGEIDRQLAFSGFFSLYFGALVAGLSGGVPRAKQVALLEAALRRFLLLEAGK